MLRGYAATERLWTVSWTLNAGYINAHRASEYHGKRLTTVADSARAVLACRLLLRVHAGG